MAAALGDCCPRPAMTWLAMVDPMPTSETSATTCDAPAFGWSAYAERVNGRFAMLGFAAVVLVELLSHDTFLHWAGLVP